MHEHSADEPVAPVAALIHPDAEMRLLVSYGELVRGRDAVVRALQTGSAAMTFRARVERFEWLDDDTALTSGVARYPRRGGGYAEGRVFWLDELRDGMIWRIQVFKLERDARRAYREAQQDRRAAPV
jgi:hypothetical protein